MNARMTTAIAALLLTVPAITAAQASDPAPMAVSPSGGGRSWSQSTPEPARAPRSSGAVNFRGDQPAPSGQAGTLSGTGVAAPQPPSMSMPSRRRGQLVNVKVEFTITDQVGTKPAVKKTMTMVVADGESSRIRTSVDFRVPMTVKNDKGELVVKATNRGEAPLSVDVSPTVEGNKVRLDFSVEYSSTELQEDGSLGSKTTVSERLAAVLDSGVPLVVAQSSDAYSDRKVTVEIKATIMK